jgi:hypothetical protein
MSKPSFNILFSIVLILILVDSGFSQTRFGKLGFGVEGSMQYSLGAGTVTSSAGLGGGVNMSYSIIGGLSVRSKFVVNQLKWTNALSQTTTTDFVSLSGYLSGDLFPNSSVNIFLLGGGGLVFYDPKDVNGTRHPTSSFDINYIGGLGADFFPNEFWSISVVGEYVMTNSPYYNGNTGATVNTGNDSYIRGSLQFRYYFFDQLFVTQLLEAQRDRMRRK